MVTFFDIGSEKKLGSKNKVVMLGSLIKWERIEESLQGIHKNSINSKGGQEAYNELKMFKAILLGQWHSLSDNVLEEALRIRLDFMVFTGFALNEEVPDETTLNRFRNKLIEKKLLKDLLEEINVQLAEEGLKVKDASGAIIDATIVKSAARARKMLETIAVDREEGCYEACNEMQSSMDPDARWLKKGRESYHGYRGYCRIDSEDGYIESVYATPANESEVTKLEAVIEGTKNGRRVYGDKGFASQSNRELLASKKLKSSLMFKAFKYNPLTHWQKKFNSLISKKRYKIEQAFATLKRKFNFARASYMTTVKVAGQLCLKAMCFNLLKALNKTIAVSSA